MKPVLALASFVLVACSTFPAGSMPASYETRSAAGSTGMVSDSDDAFVAATPARSLAPEEAHAEGAPPELSADERQVIYSAQLRLVVVSAQEGFASIQAIAKEVGGHLQESDARSITIRVPAASFESVVARIGALGELVERNIRAADVTEEMLDLGIRLENARKARERLLEHLAKSEKVEDTLAIERELTRVTEEIERMEGRQRTLQSQIAMSTIRVELNTSGPQRSGDGPVLPFEWIERLGDGLVAGSVQGLPRKPHFFSRGPYFDPPANFVRYYSDSDLVEAMNAEGVRLKLQKQDNYDKGSLAFWSQLARQTLVQRRSLAVSEERPLEDDLRLLSGTREVGGEAFGYLLVLARTRDDVYSFEVWGPKAVFEPLLPALVESAKSLRR